MKKKIGILALILAIAMCFFTISAFAGEDSGNSQMPFVDSDQITPEFPDVQTEADLIEEFEEMFGEGSGKILSVAMVGVFFMSLFIPALVTVIIFGVLNGKTKKKIKEYERFFGPIPKFSPSQYSPQMNVPNVTPSVNSTGAQMGTAPVGNTYIPQNDVNNQQGGQF
ncbi:MAG: hypothetical protein UGF89_04985 [Acutalibacteraceae bacterium]|nr:hypothetical protein [Acutalibacteraceae bacterium]